MPCILKPEKEDFRPIPENGDREWLQRFLAACPAEQMEAFTVSGAVNNPVDGSPELIKPVAQAGLS